MRALARWGLTPLLTAPLGAWGLGLGGIELQSSLNQPFAAHIPLTATPEELQGLRIAVAPREQFESRGLDRPGFLSSLEFRVVKDRSGRDVVQISSRESITEPFVTMIVEVTWARGRTLREYTVLLDPPLFMPLPTAPAPVRQAQTRSPEPSVAGGAIERPATPPPARETAPQREPLPQREAAPRLSAGPSTSASRSPELGGSYGPVRRAETLWAIAEQFRPDGVTMNQMMVAVYNANPQAFAGNMNLLQVGAVLRIPEAVDLQALARTAATAEVQRQNDAWLGRTAPNRLVLRDPPQELTTDAPPVPVNPPRASTAPDSTARAEQPLPGSETPAETPSPGAVAAGDEDRRLLEVRNEQLQNLEERLSEETPVEAPEAEVETGADSAPGVELESEQLFADEADEPETPAAEPQPEAPAPAVRPEVATQAEPSLVSRLLAYAMAPMLWIALGVGALLLTALWYVRRRRQDVEDVTGRWEALESEVDDEDVHQATERMRRQLPEEESILVEEAARPRRAEPLAPIERAAPAAATRTTSRAAPPLDDTLSSQTVINLDQADPVAEADFHMAYGLYDQAAELVSKALEAAPQRRDLRLKLLEVFFVWGNKDAFLDAAKELRAETGEQADPDWDKVVIMGKQICPDEPIFAEATSGAAHVDVDVDLEAGASPALDLAFDDAAEGGIDLDLSDDSQIEEMHVVTSVDRRPEQAQPTTERDSLDIGERTAAGLEAALFFDDEEEEAKEPDAATTPDLDSLAVTQESPTVERRSSSRDWSGSTQEMPTTELASFEGPTIETPTIESAGPEAPTMETPTIETPYRSEPPTIDEPGLGVVPSTDRTAEIDLDDLGLDVKELEDLSGLGDLPMAAGSESDTREQPALDMGDSDLLSATGVTQVLRDGDEDEFEQRKTAVLGDDDATLFAPGFDDGAMGGTEVLEHRLEVDETTGNTSLVRALHGDESDDEALDLNLDDLSAALRGADTVEQPRASSFARDIFSGNGQTPIDLDIGSDVAGADDPTGTEEVSPLDPQTMTEVGTKLDLARAYIDMGDPEGARSILEEVLDEGDSGQRREAQGLIDVLSA